MTNYMLKMPIKFTKLPKGAKLILKFMAESMNINMISTKKRKISCLAFVIRESAYFSCYKNIRKKIYTGECKGTFTYLVYIGTNFLLYHRVEGMTI